MTTTNKVRSTNVYFHEFPDGSGLKSNAFLNGEHIRWHLPYAKQLDSSIEIDWTIEKYSVDSVIDSPIGGIQSVSAKEKKEFSGTLAQYRKFVVKFWENGPDYYEQV